MKGLEHIVLSLLKNDWNVTSNPGIGATCEASVAASRPETRLTMTHILASVINQNSALTTSTVQVRDASETGTVLWQHNFFSFTTTQQQVAADVYVSGIKGNGLYIGFLTVQASVTASLSAQGFADNAR